MNALAALEPEISVVIAYGHILGDDVIKLPPNGTFNIHASLLPRWRGAAPIQAAILAGDAESGVTIMRVVRKLDAGPILLKLATPVADDETHGELQLRLAELGALALIEALALVEVGGAIETPQDESQATYAPKVVREMARVDWKQSATQISRVMRAFDPRPGAYTTKDGVEVKLFGARVALGRHSGVTPGAVLEIDESGMLVVCGEDALRIGYVFPAGRRRLAAMDWAQGRGVSVGDVLV
jgi:methionyl-tRNA formyltransferase